MQMTEVRWGRAQSNRNGLLVKYRVHGDEVEVQAVGRKPIWVLSRREFFEAYSVLSRDG